MKPWFGSFSSKSISYNVSPVFRSLGNKTNIKKRASKFCRKRDGVPDFLPIESGKLQAVSLRVRHVETFLHVSTISSLSKIQRPWMRQRWSICLKMLLGHRAQQQIDSKRMVNVICPMAIVLPLLNHEWFAIFFLKSYASFTLIKPNPTVGFGPKERIGPT